MGEHRPRVEHSYSCCLFHVPSGSALSKEEAKKKRVARYAEQAVGMMNTLELRSANMFKKIKDAAFRIIRSKWYWILALLAVTVIAFLLLGYKRAAAVLISYTHLTLPTIYSV